MKIGKVLHIILLALVAVFFIGNSLLNNTKFQQRAAINIVKIGHTTLGTDCNADKVQFVYPFGMIIDNLTIYDLNHDTLIHAASASLRIKPLQLIHKRLNIKSIKFKSPYIFISADSIGAQPNYAFLLPEDEASRSSLHSFRANSILIRNGHVQYNVKSEAETDSLFNKYHIGVSKLNTNLSIKSVTQDSISLYVRKLSLTEKSGFSLVRSKGSVTVGNDFTHISGFTASTPQSDLNVNYFTAHTGFTNHKSGIPDLDMELQATITGSDFKAFLPQTANMTAPLAITLSCSNRNDILTLNTLELNDDNRVIDLTSSGTIRTNATSWMTVCQNTLFNVSFGSTLPAWLESQLGAFGIAIPSQLRRLGKGDMVLNMGYNAGQVKSTFELNCTSGHLEGTLSGQEERLDGTITGAGIQLGTITGNKDLGRCDLTLNASINKEDDGYAYEFDSNLATLVYKQYEYHNVLLNGQVKPGVIITALDFADQNGLLALNADIRTRDIHSYKVDINASNLNLAAYNLTSQDSMMVSAKFYADLEGSSIDNIIGKITIDSILYADHLGDWQMENLTATILDTINHVKTISVVSDFLNVSIVGDYYISSLPYSISRATGDILPTIGSMITQNLRYTNIKRKNDFIVTAELNNADFMERVFHSPLTIRDSAFVKLTFNDLDSIYSGRINVPRSMIATEELSDFLVLFYSESGTCHSDITCRYGNESKGYTDINASLIAFEDIIKGTYKWHDASGSNSGYTRSIAQFFRYNRKQGLKSMLLIDPIDVKVNNVPWKFDVIDIRSDMGKVTVSGINMSNHDQFIFADGVISADSTDVLNLSLKNIDLGHALSMIGINDLGFGGIASGDVSFATIMHRPSFTGAFTIDDFEFMNSYHGQLKMQCYWDEAQERIRIMGEMDDPGVAHTLLTGFYAPGSKDIDINIGADHTDLHFLNYWTTCAFKEICGRAVGNIRIFGTIPDLDMEGEALLVNGTFNQEDANTIYHVKNDTLWFEPGKMLFKDVEFYDELGHDGMLTCILGHDHFSNWTVDFSTNVSNMLVYKRRKSETGSYYANLFAEGSMRLLYDKLNGLSMVVNARTAPGSTIGFFPGSNSVSDYNFLTIIDRNSVIVSNESGTTEYIPEQNNHSRYNLEFNIECSEDALIELDASPLAGFFRGSGNLSIKLNPQEGTMLSGIYNLSHGQCTLTIEELIRKNFNLMQGSYIRFNGTPSDTELNLMTYHNVNSASVYDLDPSASSSNNLRVRCLMDITGVVTNPQLSFNIDMPNGTSDEKAILASATATEEQRNIQFIYLLAIGRFYTFDVYAGSDKMNTPSTMESIVNSTLSTQVNRLLSQVLDNEKISISSNLSASSYLSNDATNLNNKELEGILEARLLNNRLLVNGSFGYRENTINNTSNFIGDLEVKYLLLPDRNGKGISVKGYNKANEKYFSKTSLTTQGVGIVFEKDF